MMTNLSNSLIGLSLLSGTNLGGVSTGVRVESKAVRLARAQFTEKSVVPVWQRAAEAPNAAAVLRMAWLIDKGGASGQSADVATAFTAYKALERLRALAEAGTRSALDLAALQKRFATGLAEVERWLAAAPSDQLTFAFGRAARRAESIALPAPPAPEVRGDKLVNARDLALPGLSGAERFTLQLSRPGASDSVDVDLSSVAQPPTLDRVANAFNAAIAGLPMVDANGQALLDGSGNVVPRYTSRFAVVRHEGGGWGLELRGDGIETVGLHDRDAQPALMVTASQQAEGSPAVPVTMSRMAMLTGAMDRATLPALSAEDRPATALQTPPKDGSAPPPVLAPLAIAATVTAPDGATYAVGTSRGSMGAQLADGADDLVLVKLDSRGQPLWQRSLGTAGSAEGLAVSLDPSGGVTVGGSTMTLPGGDRDLLAARFGADGEELMLAGVRQLGDQRFSAMTSLADGSSILASRDAGGATTLVRLDASGRVVQRQALDPAAGEVRGMAVDANGDLLVLSQSGENATLRRFAAADMMAAPTIDSFAGFNAEALAVAADGRVAIGGRKGGDVAVAVIDQGQTRWTDLASSGEDRIDQLLFDGGKLYAAGRTGGDLGAPRIGTVDAFVARIDAGSGAVEQVRQWGRTGTRTGPVSLSLANAGDSAVHRLGFSDGAINAAESQSLADQTALRPGDRFSLRVNGGRTVSVTIDADETAAAFAERLGRLIGRTAGKVTISRSGGAPQLRIEPSAGQRIDLLPGPEGQDALAKLGIAPGAIILPPLFDPKAPRVKPGGHYGLDLAPGLSVADKRSAKQALDRIDNAIATVRAGFRSLFWDDTKAALAEGKPQGAGPSPYFAGQLARYRDALSRLGG